MSFWQRGKFQRGARCTCAHGSQDFAPPRVRLSEGPGVRGSHEDEVSGYRDDTELAETQEDKQVKLLVAEVSCKGEVISDDNAGEASAESGKAESAGEA